MSVSIAALRNLMLNYTVRPFFILLDILILVTALTLPIATVARGGNDSKPSYTKDIDFDSFELEKVPTGFVPLLLGAGKEVSWTVKTEPSAPSGTKVLAQTSIDNLDFRFPVILYDQFTAKDIDVTVQFKTLSGSVDQAAGLIVRFQDEDHFYVVRATAFENEVRLYKVVDGIHQSIAGESTKVSSNEWHTLRVVVQNTHFQVFFDNQSLFEADDATFNQAGKVGLSTKSDSVTVFDNLHIESRDAQDDFNLT